MSGFWHWVARQIYSHLRVIERIRTIPQDVEDERQREIIRNRYRVRL